MRRINTVDAIAWLIKHGYMIPGDCKIDVKLDGSYICMIYNVKLGPKAVLYIDAVDVFAPRYPDREPISIGEIKSFLKLFFESSFGDVKWICKHRGIQPHKALKQEMIDEGEWDDEMESLSPNTCNLQKLCQNVGTL